MSNVIPLPMPDTAEKPKSSSTSLSSASALEPATEREIAVELQKLKAIFGYWSEGAWKTAALIYMNAWKDLPPDLLRRAVADYITTAKAETRFPKPGDIRAIVGEELQHRRLRAADEAEAAWPKWLEDIWGPAPEGPAKRAAEIAAMRERSRIERTGTAEEKAALKAEDDRRAAARAAELEPIKAKHKAQRAAAPARESNR
jgi:hypothetical protein